MDLSQWPYLKNTIAALIVDNAPIAYTKQSLDKLQYFIASEYAHSELSRLNSEIQDLIAAWVKYDPQLLVSGKVFQELVAHTDDDPWPAQRAPSASLDRFLNKLFEEL